MEVPEPRRRPLEGVLVVSVEQAVAAPFASVRLADAGARVIKVERPGGDFARHYDDVARGESAYFVWLNRGKESLVLDFKGEDDARLLRCILARADVFIQNLAPGAAARAGLGSRELQSRYPRLITCDISGYGEEGPYRDMRAYDLLVQAESGLASITGAPEAPGRVGVSVCDIATGMFAHGAILEALYHRQRTGEARAVTASLFASMADWMTVPLLGHDYAGRDWARVGLAHPTVAPYGVYSLKGGDEVLIGVQNEGQFCRLATEVLGRPELAGDPRFATNSARVAHRRELDRSIAEVFVHLDRDGVARLLARSRIPYGFLNTLAEVAEHPQLRRAPVATPSGEVEVAAPAVTWRGEECSLGPVPALGQHSDAIRREFQQETRAAD